MSSEMERHMDNENKVKKNKKGDKQNRVQVFFEQQYALQQNKPQLYSLEKEFAVTKKQKNLLFYLSTLLFIIALGLGTLVVTRRIDKNADKVKVDISEFKALNLTDLLNKVSKRRNSLQAALQRVKDLRVKMARELKAINGRTAAQKDQARLQIKDRSRLAARLNRLEKSKQRQVTAVINRFQGELDKLQKRIDQLKKQVSSADKKLQSDLQAGQQILDNYQRLNQLQSARIRQNYNRRIARLHASYRRQLHRKDLERERLRRFLINKYNPDFTEQQLQDALKNSVQSPPVAAAKWDKLLAAEGIITVDRFKTLNRLDRQRYMLLSRLNRIPFTNDTARALQKAKQFDYASAGGWRQVWITLLEKLRGRENTVQRYRSSILSFALRNREHGFVISVRNNKHLELVVNRRLPQAKNAFIIRGDNQRIAEISLTKTAGRDYGRVVQNYSNTAILPFDKVLLKIRQE